MSEETLLTAARRAVRFFNIDMAHGGLLSHETQRAMETLDIQVHRSADAGKGAAIIANHAGKIISERDTEIADLKRHIEILKAKISADACACGYDHPDDVCAHHRGDAS